MNSQHLLTFIWLRWRLFVRQIKRAGIVNSIVAGLLAVVIVLGTLCFATMSFLFGIFIESAVHERTPAVVMFYFDGVVVGFLFMWSAGLLADLQRSEALSIEKFLHLPVSLSGIFLLNYVSSLACLTMAVFLPLMLGFSVGICFGVGPQMLVVLPLLASFLLMVTALSYQFQGWLASLMVNKRRRRTIIVVATLVFVVIAQLPNLLNMMHFWDRPRKEAPPVLAPEGPLPVNQPGQEERQRELDEERKERDERLFTQVTDTVRLINLVVPAGWLPLGAMEAANGSVWAALLATLGMGLIGAGSLWRAYRTTIRLYTGEFTAGQGRATQAASAANAGKGPAPAAATAGQAARVPVGNMLEGQLPWISEPAAVIALGSFRSLLRAPEVKMLFLTPVFMLFFFGFMFFRNALDMPDSFRPMLGLGAIWFSLFSLIGFVGNQFGFDRGGFRLFVLSPAARRDILLGKNLAVAPLALSLCIVPLAAVQIFLPMRWDCFLALPAQFVTMYLLFCLLANLLSLLAPMAIAAGSMKPTNVKLLPVLLQLVFALLLPMVMSPVLLPTGIEYWSAMEGWAGKAAIYLAASYLECAVVVVLYWLILNWEGSLLQSLELKILQTVTTRAE